MNGKVLVVLDTKQFEGEIISEKISSTGLVKIQVTLGPSAGKATIARHVDRITPLDDAARKFLGKP